MYKRQGEPILWVSSSTGENIAVLKEKIAALVPEQKPEYPIVSDLLKPGDFVVLVVPIDKAAPKGRLILPQQQTIRDILEAGAISVVTQDDRVAETISSLKKGKSPRLVTVSYTHLFGGLCRLMELMRESAREEKNTEAIIQVKGWGCCG